MSATDPYIPRISAVFDFDSTLASDSIDSLLEAMELERDDWEARFVEPLGDGWDAILRRGQALICAGGGRAPAIDPDQDFDHEDEMSARQRVDDVAPPGYREDDELMRSLGHAVRAAASRIALRKRGAGE